MPFNREIHHRRSIRLRTYDYSRQGVYFITICTHDRLPLFGQIREGIMMPNSAGLAVAQAWQGLSEPGRVAAGEFVVMPNHFHGLLAIDSATPVAPSHRAMLGRLVGRFKMIAAKQINLLRAETGIPVWQRNYYEHIVRDEASYLKIVEYIQTNPQKWTEDRYHTV